MRPEGLAVSCKKEGADMAGVPVFDLSRQWPGLRNEIMPVLEEVLAGGQFILGENVAALEDEVASLCGVAHGIGVANGSDALVLALQALRIGPGDEVIVPPLTFVATASCIERVGATPVFADIDPRTYCLDPVETAKRVTERTRAIISVHLYGYPADMGALLAVAREHGLFVVEDGAQAIGATWQGHPVGSMGDLGTISFFPTKNLGAYGDGGMVVTSDPELADRVRMLRRHGTSKRYYHSELGMNSRLDEIQAAVLRVRLRHLPEWTVRRRQIAARYDCELADVPGLQLPIVEAGYEHVFHQYTVATERRDELREWLGAAGIGTTVYYPLGLHLQQVFARLGYRQGDMPRTEAAVSRVLSLPMFPELTDEEIVFVGQKIREFLS